MGKGCGAGVACGESSPKRRPRAGAASAVRAKKTAERAAHDKKRVTPERGGSVKNRRPRACGVTDYGFVEIGVEPTFYSSVRRPAVDVTGERNITSQIAFGVADRSVQ